MSDAADDRLLAVHRGAVTAEYFANGEFAIDHRMLPQWVEVAKSEVPGDWKTERAHGRNRCTEVGEYVELRKVWSNYYGKWAEIRRINDPLTMDVRLTSLKFLGFGFVPPTETQWSLEQKIVNAIFAAPYGGDGTIGDVICAEITSTRLRAAMLNAVRSVLQAEKKSDVTATP